MTEDQSFAPDPDSVLHSEPVVTGVPEVDAVLESVAGVDQTEVAEHPAVFERAHEQLRWALDGPA